MNEKQSSLKVTELLQFLAELTKSHAQFIIELLWPSNMTLEEAKIKHIERVIPFHLKMFLDMYGRKGISITSLGEKITIRAPGHEDDTSLVGNWEQLVAWAKQVETAYSGRSSKKERLQAAFILRNNTIIRANEQRIRDREENTSN